MEEKSREQLIRTIGHLEAGNEKCYRKIDRLYNENSELRRKSSVTLEVEVQRLQLENERLTNEISRLSAHRGMPGAGRKRKASDRDIEIIRSLAGHGLSLSEISKRLEAETNTCLSRSTIRNMINK